MKILLLSFHYPPDIGPAPLRAKSIVDSLLIEKKNNITIDVFSSMPHRYDSLKIIPKEYEYVKNLSIKRVSLPLHYNKKILQLFSYLLYIYFFFKFKKNKKWDIVIGTSSRLMTAFLAAIISKQIKAKLYLDIRDLFVDNLNDILNKSPFKILIPIFKKIEKFTFEAADKININSAGFESYVKKIVPKSQLTIYTNGIDDFFFKKNFIKKQNKKKTVLYAGNIGEGQGLHNIIPNIANKFPIINFKIIGDGNALKKLEEQLTFKSIKNVKIIKPMLRQKLILEYKKADILFLHLNDYHAFKKVLPSKLFEYAATGKPILAGVSGYAEEFIQSNLPGSVVFNPCDSIGMALGLKKILHRTKIVNRTKFCNRFMRKKIMKKMANDILTLN